MKVLYLTALEDTNKNDIHINQVFGLANHGVDYQFLFISPLFILNRQGFSINRNKMLYDNAEEVKLPILSYHLCMHVIIIPYFLLISVIPFYFRIKMVKPDVVHCRNLVSVLLAVFARWLFRLKYKIVCDPRSVYVEECVITKTFKYNCFNYKVWKKLEGVLYRKSDACIGLSEYFKNYLREHNENSFFVPAIVNTKSVYSQSRRDEMRKNNCLTDDDVVFCYIGSIGAWHSPEKLVCYWDKIKNILPEGKRFRIVFLSGNKKVGNQIIAKFGEKCIVKCGRVKPEEILDYLLISDYGMVPGSDKTGYCYDLLYKTMISSKAEEYLVAGLPIIVSPRIESLVDLIKKDRAGFVLCDEIPIYNFDRERISDRALSLFGVDSVVDSYRQIYESIV